MIVSIKGPAGAQFDVGPGVATRVMALLGCNSPFGYDAQVAKLEAVTTMREGPDVVSDLSLYASPRPLWKRVLELRFPAATLPIYSVRRRDTRIEAGELLERAIEQMEAGVGLLTIHPTPTQDIIRHARERLVPWTSRGGGLVSADLLSRQATDNVYLRILPDIISTASRYGTVLSLGASFRSANIFDVLDRAQRMEIASQLELARAITSSGVGVIIESPGHARPRDIKLVASQLRDAGYPVMPLGPIPTDVAVDMDHVAAAIGASLMGIEGAAHVLAAVTREEHTGGIPSVASTIEAIRAARVAAHVIDIHQLEAVDQDRETAVARAAGATCIEGSERAGCSRCGAACPLPGALQEAMPRTRAL